MRLKTRHIFAAALVMFGVAGNVYLTHIDNYPQWKTYGVSYGTNNTYCYADWDGSAPGINIGCEHAA
jgi:hypothetical protein